MTFYFYDLETSGINARAQRIMQFAGQRTDENFVPIGEPQNWLVTLTDEILPDPEAILITGITPQKTLAEGYSEAAFLKLFYEQVLQPDTIIVGFNNVRFDDEFMRATLWRNFYDPYEWQWQDGRSRWDLLDVVRLIRALRPEGINWPVDSKNQPTNRLELLTKANGLDHHSAHDALSDVQATIALAQFLQSKQPKMFNYLLQMRDKKKVSELLSMTDPQPLIYCSGRYGNAWQKTTAVVPVAAGTNSSILVYDLRQDPLELARLSDEELMATAFSRDSSSELLPVKAVKLNCCPAVAPVGVLDESSQKRLQLDMAMIEANLKSLRSISGFSERLGDLFSAYTKKRQASYSQETDPDFQLYDSFVGDTDKTVMRAIRATGDGLSELDSQLSDPRLVALLPRYKARNFSNSLNQPEREAWESYRSSRLLNGLNGQLSLQQYISRLAEIAAIKTDDNSQFLLQELQLYAESIAPVEAS